MPYTNFVINDFLILSWWKQEIYTLWLLPTGTKVDHPIRFLSYNHSLKQIKQVIFKKFLKEHSLSKLSFFFLLIMMIKRTGRIFMLYQLQIGYDKISILTIISFQQGWIRMREKPFPFEAVIVFVVQS